MKKCLITGITGSGGSYLAEYILENHLDYEVWGLHRWHSAGTLANIEAVKDKVHILEADLLDLSSVIRALKIIVPDRIFHLASFANVKKCFETPLAVINNNIIGTANLLEAIRMVCPETLVQMCSTSEVYGNPVILPITEEHPLKPVNPYSVSKLAQESLAYAYHQSWGLRVITTRMFAYINPRRRDLFASAFAWQIVQIERQGGVLKHGNLNSIRNIIDVRDAMAAYWVACERCVIGENYNIGGATIMEVGEFLELIKSFAKVPIISTQDTTLLRPVDVTRQVPDTTKFDTISEWKPKYTIEESVQWLLDTYRKELK